MEQSDVEVFVPGHGPLGTRADVGLQKQYIAILEDLVAGVSGKACRSKRPWHCPCPRPLMLGRHGGMGRWEANVQALYQRLSGSEAPGGE